MRSFRWPPKPGGSPEPLAPRGRVEPGWPLRRVTVTELRTLPSGVTLEYLVTGDGEPTTVFAHGLAAGISDTRPLASGVTGRKVFFQFRGHGRSAAPDGPWTYADLAEDLLGMADTFAATRALGVSLGAGALCQLLAQAPDRFEKVVFFLPAVLDEPRPAASMWRMHALLEAVECGDFGTTAELLSAEIPAVARDTPAAWRYLRERIDALIPDGLAPQLTEMPEQTAVLDRAELAHVKAEALVIGCRGDEAHPPAVAEALAGALPHATLHIYDRPAVLWTSRADLRNRISTFLNG